MADRKYGQLFTEDEVRKLIGYATPDVSFEEALEEFEADDRVLTLPPDEPTFVLRAQDVAAMVTLNSYRQEAVNAGAAEAHITGVEETIAQFQNFAAQNPNRMKVPD